MSTGKEFVSMRHQACLIVCAADRSSPRSELLFSRNQSSLQSSETRASLEEACMGSTGLVVRQVMGLNGQSKQTKEAVKMWGIFSGIGIGIGKGIGKALIGWAGKLIGDQFHQVWRNVRQAISLMSSLVRSWFYKVLMVGILADGVHLQYLPVLASTCSHCTVWRMVWRMVWTNWPTWIKSYSRLCIRLCIRPPNPT